MKKTHYSFAAVRNNMVKLFVYCTFLFSFSWTAINAQVVLLQRQLHINPSAAVSLPASDVIDAIRYIPLETTEESRFGVIEQLWTTDKYFIIVDADSYNVFVFLRNGKFHQKIPRDKYQHPYISLDRDSNQLIFSKGRTRYYYSLNGEKLREAIDPLAGSRYYFSGGRTGYADYRVMETVFPDTVGHQLYLTRSGQIYGEYLPYNMKLDPIQGNDWIETLHAPFYETGTDTTALYCRAYDYNIYQLSTSGVTIPFSFVFPQVNTFDPAFSTDPALKKGEKHRYFTDHVNQVYGLCYPYHIGPNLFFKLNTWEGKLNDNDSYLFNLKSGILVSVKSIVPDARTFYLPVTDWGIGPEFYNKNFLSADDKYVYTSFSAASLLKAAAANERKKVRYDPALRAFLNRENKKDNPVIVQLKAKKRID
jgi:hypothetical protein